MESSRYPNATFTGKIIENVDFSKEGVYTVRAKGKLTIHGVAQERILKSRVDVKGGGFSIRSYFTVILEEHNISVPKIVYQKIAEEIQVQVKATFEKVWMNKFYFILFFIFFGVETPFTQTPFFKKYTLGELYKGRSGQQCF